VSEQAPAPSVPTPAAPTPAPTPQPGASAIPAEPLSYLNGQPFNRQSAADERARLMADDAYRAAALNGSVEHQQYLAALWRIAHGGYVPAEPTTAEQVMERQSSAEIARLNWLGDFTERNTTMTEQQIVEYVNNRPIPQAQRDHHIREWNRLKSDPAMVRPWADGDLEARREFDRHGYGRKMRVGTLAEIEAWEHTHGNPSYKAT
jgi:hypothetical protein